jgi:hypothetical protein
MTENEIAKIIASPALPEIVAALPPQLTGFNGIVFRFPFSWAIRMIFNAKTQRRKDAGEEETNLESQRPQNCAALIKASPTLLSLCAFAALRLCVEFRLHVCTLTPCLPAGVAFPKGGFA